MTFLTPGIYSTALFIVIVVSVVCLFLAAVHHVYQDRAGNGRIALMRAAFAVIIWLGLLCFMSGSGWIERAPMPRLLVFFALSNGAAIVLAFSPLGFALSQGLTIRALIAFQSFRLPLEWVLHDWALSGSIPQTMTWSGYNFDIVTGLVSIIALPFVGRSRALSWGVALLGFALLINVARVATLSSPFAFGWGVQPPLQLAFHLPYALIVPVCVGGALAGHLILFRALLRQVH